jgi:amino acid permease
VIPEFITIDFISYYIEIPVMFVMFVAWTLFGRSTAQPSPTPKKWWSRFFDLVDIQTVDLFSDQYEEDEQDRQEERRTGKSGIWRLYYWLV